MTETWRIELLVPAAAVPMVEAALDGLTDALLCFEIEAPGPDQGLWRVEGLCERPPDRARLTAALALAARAANIAEPAVSVERMAPRDWLTETMAGFPPLDIGRFHVRGSHVSDPPPPGRHALVVDAATAFGSGEHATTRGCLMALDDLARRPRWPRRVLDMGCGTAVLALAAAAHWRCPVLAVDNDAEAVRVARHNTRRNGLSARVRCLRSDGFRDARVTAGGSYDLILANILARPLTAMSAPAAAVLAPGGRIVLSGLLATQEARVVNAYRRQGLALERRYPIAEWMTLVMRRRGRA
ncbi:50S ribosomal protein L11 methyltransferase [Rhodospira trueperi]|uniref:Ribosomal protein L11 methyltransferase n=1 Tax=Rhodospira trueperi TaxID=69960 RepID=A0A1G7F1C9_9PROT|nr:50S ribosomal protein L11 methyltransferase [Rhodospira trueperi]SDE69556.1 ribosomal protein L11 methyltransferase [Rhodospira trueperi]